LSKAGFDTRERTPAPAGSQHAQDERRRVTAIEIEVPDRWDALALSEELIPFHSFLVQHDTRWVVHANAPGYRGQPLSRALEAVDGWHAKRRANASCRVGGRPYQLGERSAA
jgi:hypothetical protein